MIRSLKIYIYAIFIVIGSGFKLRKSKKLASQSSNQLNKEKIFAGPKMVSQKVIQKTKSDVHVYGQVKLPDEAVLFVANHQGLFDILVLIGYLGKPIGFIAKKETKKLPIVSTWMELIHCVFIDRSDRRQAVKAINQGIAHLKIGHSIVVFPEGTRSRGSNLNEFKSGSLRLATKAKVPIVPVAINGTYQMMEEDKGKIKPSTITMTITEPIYPSDYQDKKHGELAASIQTTIQETIRSQDTANLGKYEINEAIH
ncbi:1-acyl-sn-glycerol-3-phosphate acyltransferase [Virgibacillus subterraneus]|uniref:1-acyl-sn-glycerol-3-phosphate acyltransferase n=1 Tax=Virgibacillus subterraneus TaxID=621109 RepID=A0A1H9JEQ7_9BACI|nr:lysophospholipid acyltransferase family protein [Virgibacillus subterraneus]SEQ85322.1 1-acyl-sn-glycerol-3-phosphate acyltransferase [Virgibacillus subterraneus]